MSRSISIYPGQKNIYRLEIYQIFKPRTYMEKREGVERVRLDEPVLIELGWYSDPSAARSYGSLACGTAKWYGNKDKPTRYVWDYVEHKGKEIVPDRGEEPDKDYKVFRVPVSLEMGEAVELPPLKRLYKIEE